MTYFGERLLQAAEEGLAFARGEPFSFGPDAPVIYTWILCDHVVSPVIYTTVVLPRPREFERHLKVARKVMKRRHGALAELAKR